MTRAARGLVVAVAVIGLVAIAIWGRDARGITLAGVLATAMVVLLLRDLEAPRPTPTPIDARPAAHAGTTVDDLITAFTSVFIVVAALVGGVVGWFGTDNVVAAVGGVVVFGTAAVLVAGIVSGLVSLVAEALTRSSRRR